MIKQQAECVTLECDKKMMEQWAEYYKQECGKKNFLDKQVFLEQNGRDYFLYLYDVYSNKPKCFVPEGSSSYEFNRTLIDKIKLPEINNQHIKDSFKNSVFPVELFLSSLPNCDKQHDGACIEFNFSIDFK